MLELLKFELKYIRQGHYKTCGCEIWNIFDVKMCYDCQLNKKVKR